LLTVPVAPRPGAASNPMRSNASTGTPVAPRAGRREPDGTAISGDPVTVTVRGFTRRAAATRGIHCGQGYRQHQNDRPWRDPICRRGPVYGWSSRRVPMSARVDWHVVLTELHPRPDPIGHSIVTIVTAAAKSSLVEPDWWY